MNKAEKVIEAAEKAYIELDNRNVDESDFYLGFLDGRKYSDEQNKDLREVGLMLLDGYANGLNDIQLATAIDVLNPKDNV